MQMTKQEFGAAVDAFQQNLTPNLTNDRERRVHARVLAAIGAVIKQRLGISDDVLWEMPQGQERASMVQAFLADITPRQRGLLKQIAEGLELQETPLH